QRAGAVGEEQAGALELVLSDLQAVLQIEVVILVGLGVDDHGMIDPALGHAPQEMLGGGGLGGLVGSIWMVGEAGVVLACEAVEVGVDHGGSAVGGVGTEAARQQWNGGGLEELASLHGG